MQKTLLVLALMGGIVIGVILGVWIEHKAEAQAKLGFTTHEKAFEGVVEKLTDKILNDGVLGAIADKFFEEKEIEVPIVGLEGVIVGPVSSGIQGAYPPDGAFDPHRDRANLLGMSRV